MADLWVSLVSYSMTPWYLCWVAACPVENNRGKDLGITLKKGKLSSLLTYCTFDPFELIYNGIMGISERDFFFVKWNAGGIPPKVTKFRYHVSKWIVSLNKYKGFRLIDLLLYHVSKYVVSVLRSLLISMASCDRFSSRHGSRWVPAMWSFHHLRFRAFFERENYGVFSYL